MTPGQVAGLIAAGAFLLLVIFIGLFFIFIVRALEEIIRNVNVITKDIDVISKQSDDILSNANVLLEDVNQKVSTIDPVFQAAADLGKSVSELNDATRNLAGKMSKKTKKTAGDRFMSFLGKIIFKTYWNRKTK